MVLAIGPPPLLQSRMQCSRRLIHEPQEQPDEAEGASLAHWPFADLLDMEIVRQGPGREARYLRSLERKNIALSAKLGQLHEWDEY
ncbi:hypothetical protein FA13DRAFT_1456069 [Coprinellus micaceus]|uniref:Uncharacterized protein n=1 Tax=Coprinellus micaceus TaxID=71717 RepID=A0A4Y7SNB4_COPMI|nr:hypothetical protein FA13DRAFT_1456069 [Coprinellus micaceus]